MWDVSTFAESSTLVRSFAPASHRDARQTRPATPDSDGNLYGSDPGLRPPRGLALGNNISPLRGFRSELHEEIETESRLLGITNVWFGNYHLALLMQ